MNVLALDLSLTATGWARQGDSGVITPKCTGIERIQLVRDIIGDTLLPADFVVMEGPSLHSQGRGTCDRWSLRGAILMLLVDRGMVWAEVPPTSLKLYATGKGNSGKDAVIAAAVRNGFEGSNNNEADAWWLLQMAQSAYSGREEEFDYRKRAMAKMTWPALPSAGLFHVGR